MYEGRMSIPEEPAMSCDADETERAPRMTYEVWLDIVNKRNAAVAQMLDRLESLYKQPIPESLRIWLAQMFDTLAEVDRANYALDDDRLQAIEEQTTARLIDAAELVANAGT